MMSRPTMSVVTVMAAAQRLIRGSGHFARGTLISRPRILIAAVLARPRNGMAARDRTE